MTRHSDPRIDEAIGLTYQTHPYYAAAVSRLRIVADPNVPTMGTSKDWVTHYNPATVAGWTVAETAAVLVHEVEHLLRDHSGRCGSRDPMKWNVAGDAEINQHMQGLPEGGIYPETLGMPRGLAAETYYGANPANASGEGSGEGSGTGMPSCGSSAGGPTQPHETGDAANPGQGAAFPDETRQEVARAVLQVGAGIGTDPGDTLRDWAERELGIDRSRWYAALAGAVGHTMAPYGAPTRWRWPGRRDPRDVGGALLPRWTGERPSCAIVIDTSGSITPYDLEMAKAAAHFIGRMADVEVYGCDTSVRHYGKTVPERIVGGGGTRLEIGITKAIEDGAKAVVVITDCINTDWGRNVGIPVIIGANPSAPTEYTKRIPDWMAVLPITDEPGESDEPGEPGE